MAYSSQTKNGRAEDSNDDTSWGVRSGPVTLFKGLITDDTFSSLSIMGIRVAMLIAKFSLSIFIARFMGLEDLGIYGLLVGAAATVQTVLRGGVLHVLARDAVTAPLTEITHNLRHYGTGVAIIYLALIPVAIAAGWYFDAPVLAMLALAVFLTEHLSYDAFILVNNLQHPRLANLIYSLQSASWIYLFIILALLYPSLRSIEFVLAFWISGGVAALLIVLSLSRRWPWKQAFARKFDWLWFRDNVRKSFRLYLADVMITVNYYMDRYIVTLFLNLEITGIYVFFSQVVTATWNLVDSGVMILFRPRLIHAYNKSMEAFEDVFRACLKRAYLFTFVLGLVSGSFVPVLVTFTHNEDLLAHIPLLWVMLGALVFKIGETSAGTGLYAMRKDRDTFIMSVIGFVLTLFVGSLSVVTFGVYGIVLNTIIVSTASVLYARAVWGKKKLTADDIKEKRYA